VRRRRHDGACRAVASI